MGRVWESLIEIGRELYREGAANSNTLLPYLLVWIWGITSSESYFARTKAEWNLSAKVVWNSDHGKKHFIMDPSM